jgi:hypothetical protein
LVIETADGLIGLSAVFELKKSEAALLTGFPVSRNRQVRKWANSGEVLSQLRFGDIERKIPDVKTNTHCALFI